MPGSDTFAGPYSFINPTFYAKEGVVRGVGYGMPGNTALYKYKWNGLRVDTMEYIYHNADDTRQHSFYSTNRPIEEENVIKRRLNSLPAEYRSITDFDWFGE
jgi:hypothetical protein